MAVDLYERIADGLCKCGCGQPAPLSTQTRSERGQVKGQPVDYIYGHWSRVAPKRKNIMEMFRTDENGCWVWTGFKQRGYGFLGRSLAHRVMYERVKGAIPVGLELDHLCRNRACVNPDHLEAVTKTINLRRGVGTTLTMEKAQAIRHRRETTGESYPKIARDYGVSAQCIRQVCLRRTWL